MSDLIKKSDAIKAFTLNSKGERIPFVDCDNFPVEFPLKDIVDTLAALPSADRPQGEWIADRPDAPMFGAHRCSECGGLCADIHYRYCPNCGAKMEDA